MNKLDIPQWVVIGLLVVIAATSVIHSTQSEQSLGGGLTVNRILGATTIGGTNVTTASTEVIAAAGSRQYAIIVNASDTVMNCAVGTAAVLNQGITLNANGGAYEILPENLLTGAVNCIHGGSGNKVATTMFK